MTRVVSALILGALVASTLWLLPPWATAVLACVAAGLASVELARLAGQVGAPVPAAFLATATVSVVLAVAAAAHPVGSRGDLLAIVLGVIVVAAGSLTLALGAPSPAAFTRAAVLVMGAVYVGAPLGSLVSVQQTLGPSATTWLVAILASSDITQYYTGRQFGRTKLAPAISPGKTNEGAIGGVTAAVLAGAALGPVCAGTTIFAGAVTGLLVATFGIAGDLFESLLKRSAGAKDASDLIPGHGGILDRLDSYLFAAPIFFLLLRHVV